MVQKRPLARFALCLVVGTMVLVGCTLQAVNEPRRPDPANEPTPVPTSVAVSKPTYTVARGTVLTQINFSGRVAPQDELTVLAPIGGEVADVLVGQGDSVVEGDLIAILDSRELEDQLVLAQNDLEIARQRLATAEAQVENARRRAEIDLTRAQLQLDYARSQAGENPTEEEALAIRLRELDVEVAQLALDDLDLSIDPALAAEVVQTQLVVDELTTAIEEAKIYAPTDGTIISLSLREGRSVAAEEAVAVIGNLEELEISASLRGAELQQLTEGLSAVVTVSGQPNDDQLAATIRTLPYPYGSGNQDGDDQQVRLALDNPAQAADLALGDRVNITIVLEQHDDTLWLPTAAVREFNGRYFVVVQDEAGAQSRVDVTIGLEGNGRLELLEGVSEGQTVIGP